MRAARLACAALLVLMGCATASAAPDALDALMQLLAQRQHGHVSFTEVEQLKMLQQPLHSSGELLYERPDHLEKRTLSPRAETLRLEHGTLTLERGHRTRTLALADYPQLIPFIESIRATLAGDRASLERYFSLALTGSIDEWTLELTPRDAQLQRSVQWVHIRGVRDAMRTVQIRQGDGDESTLTIGADLTP